MAKAKWAAVAAGAWLIIAPPTRAAEDPAEFFEMKVRPLLARNCYACHTTSRMSGLQLDSRENVLKGGSRGPALVPGNPEESLLIQATSYSHEKLRMPPSGPLRAEEIAILKTWIRDGAVWPADPSAPASKSEPYVITAEQRKFWSFQPVVKPAVPEVKNQNWPHTAIDRFILAKLEKSGIKPVEPADKRTLIRRATFDLIGLPPSPEEVDAFVSDNSPNAFVRVVDRLLASPHYGERWARYWLDLARYSDGKLGSTRDDPYPNAFRYRDWVIEAFNRDLPYDLFLKAQIAADLLETPHQERLLPALGFQALGPRVVAGVPADDRVDVVGRSMLGLTTGCAQCHDHKYDPIPTGDYYSLLGVFKSTDDIEIPLAPADQVDAYKAHRKKMDDLQASIDDYIEKQNQQLMEIFFAQISSYMMASWTVLNSEKPDLAAAAGEQKLDRETLRRWVEYLRRPEKEHQYLRKWYEATGKNAPRDRIQAVAEEFQSLASAIYKEKQAIDDRNYVKLGGAEGSRKSQTRTDTQIEFLPADKGYLMSDLTAPPYMNIGDGIEYPQGIFYYGAKRLPSERGVDLPPERLIDRFLYRQWRDYLESMRTELAALRNKMPPPYPFLHAAGESKNPSNLRVSIRGDAANLGDEAPRRFLQILCDGECKPFTQGSGRRELAAAIADPRNPLTARVLVNRLWAYHFGHGIVRTTSNFGQLGERPTHPELLDYLASRFIENGWSIKKMHREIMLSAVYSLSSRQSAEGNEKDPENRLLWRANIVQRLDVEALRDSLLAVAGNLERSIGGPPRSLSDEKNNRRTIYGTVGRSSLNVTLSLFDFPDANSLSEERVITAGPLQRLFFLNSDFVARQAEALAGRVAREAGENDRARIERAYRLLYGRPATDPEIRLGLDFLKESGRSWPQYAQVLLSSTEFFSVN